MLCESCSLIVVNLNNKTGDEAASKFGGEALRLEVEIEIELQPYIRSPATACCLCAEVADALVIKEKSSIIEAWRIGPMKFIVGFQASYTPKGGNKLDEIDLSFSIRTREPEADILHVFYLHCTPLTDHDTPENNLPGLLPQVNPMHLGKTSILHTLQAYIYEHMECIQPQKDFFPTRLVAVGNRKGDARLVVTQEENPSGGYVTLSHRWGPQAYRKLTRESLEDLKRGIEEAELPATLQDAIEVARSVDVGYIWIDSLCIMQDSDDSFDWARESQTMDDVYGQALFNIAAMGVKDNSIPLFREELNNCLRPFVLSLNKDGKSAAYRIENRLAWYDEERTSTLLKRGWVFQEMYFSRRIVHFGERRLAWECRECALLQLFDDTQPISSRSSIFMTRLEETKAVEMRDSGVLSISLRKHWSSLLSEFMECDFTRARDKLVGMAGIVKNLQLYFRQEFLAGFWRDDLIASIDWSHSEDELCYSGEKHSCFPSWSWATLDTRSTRIYDYVGKGSFVISKLINFDPGLSVFDQNGAMAGGITVLGPLFPIGDLWKQWCSNELFRYFLESYLDGGFVWLGWDVEEAEASQLSKEGALRFLLTRIEFEERAYTPFGESFVARGILVTRVQASSSFKRVGFLRIQYPLDPVFAKRLLEVLKVSGLNSIENPPRLKEFLNNARDTGDECTCHNHSAPENLDETSKAMALYHDLGSEPSIFSFDWLRKCGQACIPLREIYLV